MNGTEVLRIVDAIHRDKNIDKEIVFEGIGQAILSAARKHFGEEGEIIVSVDRQNGQPHVRHNGEDLTPEVIEHVLGRIAAQTAKQVMIQKIREAERDATFDEYAAMKSTIVSGAISRMEGGTATVNLGKIEAILPRSEQVPGESHRVGERVRAIVLDVRKAGSRVKIVLSRAHPDLVRRLFEIEIPEVADRLIEVRSLAREAGYRSKVAVSCFDSKIDCVGACVGVRGQRIKSIVDELAGERIDIVRWNDSLQVLVPNALQPAEVEDVILCPMLGKVIVLVREDQLSLAIGKKGQNVRLASKLVGWDISVMTQARLDEQLNASVGEFSRTPGVTEELAESLVSQGFFTWDDLSVIEPDQLAELGGLTMEQCDEIVEFADAEALRVEAEENERRARDIAAGGTGARDSRFRGPGSGGPPRPPAAVIPVTEADAPAVKPEGDASSVESAAEASIEGNGATNGAPATTTAEAAAPADGESRMAAPGEPSPTPPGASATES